MAVYKVTAKQVYFVEAETPEEAQMHFIVEDDNVGTGYTEVTDIEEVEDE